MWYICKKQPDFNTVRKQQKHTIGCKISPMQLPFQTRNISTLRNLIRKYTIALNSRYISYNAFVTYPNANTTAILRLENVPPPPHTPAKQLELFIDDSMLLEFSTQMRRSRDKKNIEVHARKQVSQTDRSVVLHLVGKLGYNLPYLSYKARVRIARCVC